MNWDSLRDLTGSRPRLAAIVGAISLAGGGVGAIVNGVDVLDLVGGSRIVNNYIANSFVCIYSNYNLRVACVLCLSCA